MTRYSLPPAQKTISSNILSRLMLRMLLGVGRCHPMTFLKLAVAFTSVTSLIAFMCIIYPGFHADPPGQASQPRQPIQASTTTKDDATFPLVVWSLGSIALGCILGSVLLSSWFQSSPKAVKPRPSDRPKLPPNRPARRSAPPQSQTKPVVTIMPTEVIHPLDHPSAAQWPVTPTQHASQLPQPQQWANAHGANAHAAATDVNLTDLLDLRKRYGLPEPEPNVGYSGHAYQFEPQYPNQYPNQHPQSYPSRDRYQNG